MSTEEIGLFVDIIRAGALLEGLVREAVAGEPLNDTDVWVLLAMGVLSKAPGTEMQSPRSPTAVSAQLGFARARVSMSFKRLVKLKLVRPAPTLGVQDGRAKLYSLSAKGRRQAVRLFEGFAVQERKLRSDGRLAHNARKVDLQVVAHWLSRLSTSRDQELPGLDRRRLSGRRHPPQPAEDE